MKLTRAQQAALESFAKDEVQDGFFCAGGTLGWLKRNGLVERVARLDGSMLGYKRLYRLTEAGKQVLAELHVQLGEVEP